MEYHAITSSITVKPVCQAIYSELATEICIADDGAGPYVKIMQDDCNAVAVDSRDWPLVKQSVERLLEKIDAGEI